MTSHYLGRRLILAVDVAGYSQRTDAEQHNLQAELVEILESAAARSGLDRTSWLTQTSGDGELAILPIEVSDTSVIDDYTTNLLATLGEFNKEKRSEKKLNLRMAISCGIVTSAAAGFSGQAVVAAARLLDSDSLRSVLRITGGPLAVALSRQLYSEVVAQGHTRLKPADCAEFEVSAKTGKINAWFTVPGRSITDVPRISTETPTAPTTQSSSPPTRKETTGNTITTTFNAPVSMPNGRIGGVEIHGA